MSEAKYEFKEMSLPALRSGSLFTVPPTTSWFFFMDTMHLISAFPEMWIKGMNETLQMSFDQVMVWQHYHYSSVGYNISPNVAQGFLAAITLLLNLQYPSRSFSDKFLHKTHFPYCVLVKIISQNVWLNIQPSKISSY